MYLSISSNILLTTIPLCLNANGRPIQLVPINALKTFAKSVTCLKTDGLQNDDGENFITPWSTMNVKAATSYMSNRGALKKYTQNLGFPISLMS